MVPCYDATISRYAFRVSWHLVQVPTDADYERWGEEIKDAIRRVVEKDESEDVIEVLEGAAVVARAALAGRSD